MMQIFFFQKLQFLTFEKGTKIAFFRFFVFFNYYYNYFRTYLSIKNAQTNLPSILVVILFTVANMLLSLYFVFKSKNLPKEDSISDMQRDWIALLLSWFPSPLFHCLYFLIWRITYPTYMYFPSFLSILKKE